MELATGGSPSRSPRAGSPVAVDRRYGPDEVRDILRRYGINEKYISKLWQWGVGKTAFMRQDFIELTRKDPLVGDKLRRLQDKWRERSENFLHDRPPHHQRAVSKLRDFFQRHGMEKRSLQAGMIIDNYSHDQYSLFQSMQKKHPSVAAQLNFLKEWADDCKREERRKAALGQELDRYYTRIGKTVGLRRGLDVIRAFDDDPRMLYEELLDANPENELDLEWLRSWAESVENTWGEEVELQAKAESEELAKRSDRELRSLKTELRILDDQMLDAMEEETERRFQIRKIERQNELLRKDIRQLSLRPSSLLPLEDKAVQCDVEEEDDEPTEGMHAAYARQSEQVASQQRSLHQKQLVIKQLRQALSEKQERVYRNRTALSEFDSMLNMKAVDDGFGYAPEQPLTTAFASSASGAASAPASVPIPPAAPVASSSPSREQQQIEALFGAPPHVLHSRTETPSVASTFGDVRYGLPAPSSSGRHSPDGGGGGSGVRLQNPSSSPSSAHYTAPLLGSSYGTPATFPASTMPFTSSLLSPQAVIPSHHPGQL
eukprot:Rhum_TRINITY_DN471_c0_g1::Rhum_TRINITY_DN471_c0_g1_i1::g.1326::m.1326